MATDPMRPEWERFWGQVRIHEVRLRAYIRGLGVRMDAVDDVAQEALLVALEKVEEFDWSGDFGAWVCQIARRLVANERRKSRRQSRILSEQISELLIRFSADVDSPLARVALGEEIAALRECVGRLPRESRELLEERYFGEVAPGLMASRRGCTSGQIRQALLRIRRELAACLDRRLGLGTA